mgnify:CR=1 FL=1
MRMLVVSASWMKSWRRVTEGVWARAELAMAGRVWVLRRSSILRNCRPYCRTRAWPATCRNLYTSVAVILRGVVLSVRAIQPHACSMPCGCGFPAPLCVSVRLNVRVRLS